MSFRLGYKLLRFDMSNYYQGQGIGILMSRFNKAILSPRTISDARKSERICI